jgi:hypothetical protein
MLWVSKEKLSNLVLKETLDNLNIENYQVTNNVDYKWNTVLLWWLKAA